MSSRIDISIKRLWRVLPFVLHEVHAVCQSGVKTLTDTAAIEMNWLGRDRVVGRDSCLD
jgi:hypothetical protein